MGLGRRTKEAIVKWNQMTALRFQTQGETSDIPGLPSGDVTRERISCILEVREILLLFWTGFNLVNAAIVCAILESISGLELSSVITDPRYLKLLTVSSLYLFTLMSVLMPLVLFVISQVFSELISMQ